MLTEKELDEIQIAVNKLDPWTREAEMQMVFKMGYEQAIVDMAYVESQGVLIP